MELYVENVHFPANNVEFSQKTDRYCKFISQISFIWTIYYQEFADLNFKYKEVMLAFYRTKE